MRKYEFVYILDPSLDETAVKASLEKYVQLIKDHGGEVTHHDVWGRRKFAFEINKKTEGTYLLVRMTMEPKIVDEINRVLRFDESVVRSLIVIDEEWERRNAEAREKAAAKVAAKAEAAR